MRIAILIPAYNAAGTISEVLQQSLRFVPPQDIVVVDDGSSDDTGAVARVFGVMVLAHPANMGKGAALRTGFGHVLSESYDGVIALDADGQHDPRFIPRFIDQLSCDEKDLVIGSRMGRAGKMPLIRQITNRLTSAIVSALAGQRIPDSQSGYRIIRAAVLKALRLRTTRYETESEVLIQAGRLHFRIGSLPISSLYGNEKSSIRPARDSLRFIRLVLRIFFSL